MITLTPLKDKGGIQIKPCKPRSFPQTFVIGGISYIDNPELPLPNQWFWHEYDGLEHGPFISSGKALFDLYLYLRQEHEHFHGLTNEGTTIQVVYEPSMFPIRMGQYFL